MLFNSIEFVIFLPIVFILYWFVTNRNLKLQNLLLLVASYVFYGWWDWRFLSLIVFSSLVDYFVGLKIDGSPHISTKKKWLFFSIGVNLGLLGIFKYYNFFIQSWVDAWATVGYEISPYTIKVILPVGISFYTFQTLSYSIDIYKGKLKPTRDYIAFASFVSFFPQLVAGPIERATNLLPQFYKRRQFEYDKAVDGMRQILWGLFKKIVIADNCAITVNQIFADYTMYNGSELLIGGVFFAFQIYGDFSGYSDIAIGVSRLFGFDLMRNFNYPYFSRDIAEFWRRWHISLSSWFRDYVYIPLGGSKGSNHKQIRNIFIIFIVSGFWHGANWTFIVWGVLNAVYFLPLMLLKKNRSNLDIVAKDKLFPSTKEVFQMGVTFMLTIIAWVIFRSNSISDAVNYIIIMVNSIFTFPRTDVLNGEMTSFLGVCLLIIIEWVQRSKQHGLEFNPKHRQPVIRWAAYLSITYLVMSYLKLVDLQNFIYFQF
jgi:alginate O-acetyltransferase complex protein AlgI